jgi:hypothetical protein
MYQVYLSVKPVLRLKTKQRRHGRLTPTLRRTNMISPRKTYQTRRAQPLVSFPLRLPPSLYDALSDKAADQGTSMTALIVEMLTEAVKEESK